MALASLFFSESVSVLAQVLVLAESALVLPFQVALVLALAEAQLVRLASNLVAVEPLVEPLVFVAFPAVEPVCYGICDDARSYSYDK